MDLTRLQQILGRAQAKRILVIGDLMLDEFVWGKVGRISPEAPVPVVEVNRESFHAGGAANVARNLRQFSKYISVMGMIGSDDNGKRLRQLLAKGKIDSTQCLGTKDYPTTVKTRIIAQHQQVVRVDREKITKPGPSAMKQLARSVVDRLKETDAIIFEDYGKGFLSTELVESISRAARSAGTIVTADPNPRSLIAWQGVTAVTPNRSEAFAAAGVPWRESNTSPKKDADLAKVGKALLKKWSLKYLLITLGEGGMMLFQKDRKPHHIPTKAREVYDVSGAGDTAIALFTLALAGGATPIEAAEIANHASAVVVSKLGTETVSRNELIASFRDDETEGGAVFLDRDGTLMHDVDYCGDPKDVDLFKGVPEALRKLKKSGYKLIVITNQSGIARDYFNETQYRVVEREVSRQIGDKIIDATYHCPHLPIDGCKCRKPSPEMVFQAAREHDIDLARSFFVGDKQSDIDCGRNADVKTILVRTGYGQETNGQLADFIAKDLSEAADIILKAATERT